MATHRRRSVPAPSCAGAAWSGLGLALLASVCLAGTPAAAQGASQTTLPQTMRAPPLRGDIVPSRPDDGRVGDPLAAALLLLPSAPPGPAAPAGDGAVGDLLANVPPVPATKPSQTEIDGKAGDLLAYVPRIPAARPAGSPPLEAALAPGAARQPPVEMTVGEMTVGEKECRRKLAAAGARFSEHDRLTDPSGCLVPFPIVLTALGGGIGLEPEAVLNCQAALALADYARDIVSPQARARFGAALKTVNHASAYVCRGRVGTGETKLSEHAFGNAIDIGSFELAGGRRLDVRAYGPGEAAERDFMRAVRGSACGPWKTVLGPGTNADHATHFHLDLAERRRGGTYCK